MAPQSALSTHRRPMLSLANAFSPEELAAWEERNARLNPTPSRALRHRDQDRRRRRQPDLPKGRFEVGATRGNGVIGEDVTPNLKTVSTPLVPRAAGTRS
ncbi:MAG: hypothetical protein R2909_23680 [Gemmatimonadales bacterium]